MARILAPRLAVILDDDVEYTIQTDNRDMVRFDLIRGRNRWPGTDEAPMLWLTVLAWSCLSREGKLPGKSADSEIDRIISVTPVDENGDPIDLTDPAAGEALTVDPT